MSQAKLLFFALFFFALVLPPSRAVDAQVPLTQLGAKQFDQSSSKVVDVKNNPDGTKTVTYRDAAGVTQLALLNCNDVPDFPGLQGLCNVLDSGLNFIGDSIKGLSTAIGQIGENFIGLLRQKMWELLFGKNLGVVTLGVQGLGNALWSGYEPSSYNPQGVSLDTQKPPVSHGILPLRLVGMVYNNAPNLNTVDALAYTVNHNLLGINTTLAMDCNKRPDGFYAPGVGNHTADEACPGRIRLNPMYKIWEGIRNIAYLAIVLVLVAFGFMVMFRSKIDPRTVITAQSAIPRLAIGLIAIAFSYIIASLAVDLGQAGLSSVAVFFRDIRVNNSLHCVLTGSSCQPFPFLQNINDLNDLIFSKLDFKPPTSNNPLLDGLASLIMGFITWYIVFQIFFALITNYAQIFVKTALGPLLIAFGIIPGQSDAISKWFKGLLANALVFPGIYFIVNLAIYINNYSYDIYLPSPIDQTSAKPFLMLGLFVVASKVPAVIEEFLGTQSSGAVSRAGSDVSQVARKIPVVGSLIG